MSSEFASLTPKDKYLQHSRSTSPIPPSRFKLSSICNCGGRRLALPKVLQINSQAASQPVDEGEVSGNLIHLQNCPIAELMFAEPHNIFLLDFLYGMSHFRGVHQHGVLSLGDLIRLR